MRIQFILPKIILKKITLPKFNLIKSILFSFIFFSFILSTVSISTGSALENQTNLTYPQVNLKMDRTITVVDGKVITEEKVKIKNTGIQNINGRYWTFSLNSEDIKIYDSIGELPTKREVKKEGIDIICTFRYPVKPNETYTYTVKETRRDILTKSDVLNEYLRSLENKYERGEISEEVYRDLSRQYEEILKNKDVWVLYNWISTIYPFPTYDVTTEIILPRESKILKAEPRPYELKEDEMGILITYKAEYIPPSQNPPITIIFKAPLGLSIKDRISLLKSAPPYYVLSFVLLVIGLILLLYAKKKGWLEESKEIDESLKIFEEKYEKGEISKELYRELRKEYKAKKEKEEEVVRKQIKELNERYKRGKISKETYNRLKKSLEEIKRRN